MLGWLRCIFKGMLRSGLGSTSEYADIGVTEGQEVPLPLGCHSSLTSDPERSFLLLVSSNLLTSDSGRLYPSHWASLQKTCHSLKVDRNLFWGEGVPRALQVKLSPGATPCSPPPAGLCGQKSCSHMTH